ncbi:MAG: carbonic anhydrase family protein [Planctomycetota bacterium]
MTPQSNESQKETTPGRALELLVEGNRRFVAQAPLQRDALAAIAETKGGQAPFAAVLSCIDSRVPVEMVFDQGIGDVFSARIAGNFVNDDLLGSIEFATKVAGSKLVVVLGHTSCGAVKGAVDDVRMGHLTRMLAHIRPAVDAVDDPTDPALRVSSNASFVDDVVVKNVDLSVQAIRERSPLLREQEADGEILIVGAVYDVATGGVDFRR